MTKKAEMQAPTSKGGGPGKAGTPADQARKEYKPQERCK